MTTSTEIISTADTIPSTLVYSNALYKPTLATLLQLGKGDCSDYTWAVYNAHGYDIGGMSYEQAVAGTEIASWSGPASESAAAFTAIASHVQPADLVCMSLDRSRPGVISHVELSRGGILSSGHGGPGRGPTTHDIRSAALLGSATRWTVRRIINTTNQETGDEELNNDQAKKLDNTNYAISKIVLPVLTRLDKARYSQTQALATLQGQMTGILKALSQSESLAAIDMDAITAAAEKGAKEGAAAINAADVAAQLEVTTK